MWSGYLKQNEIFNYFLLNNYNIHIKNNQGEDVLHISFFKIIIINKSKFNNIMVLLGW